VFRARSASQPGRKENRLSAKSPLDRGHERRCADSALPFGARVFEDADYLLIPTFREEDGEDRYKVIGMVNGKFWTAVQVRHGDTVRFISVRRSNDGEEKQYLA
jgi:uncharacterized DUF497 family protein